MELPLLLYGRYNDVRKRCRKVIARSIREQQAFWVPLEHDGMIDTAEHPGLIVVDGPSPLVGDDMHYHCYMPLYLFLTDRTIRQLSPIVEDEIFTIGLERLWSFLCMFSRNAMYTWLKDTDHYRRYVEAALRYWSDLDVEGSRYSSGSNHGEQLWTYPSALKFALARLGVPHDLLKTPLPVGGLYALLAQADRARAGNLVDVGAAKQSSWHRVASDSDQDKESANRSLPEGVFMGDEMSAALHANDAVTVQRLIDAGASVDTIDLDTLRSPLLWAAEQGYRDLVGVLLDRGANIEDRADEGESPLMLAAYGGHRDVVQLLLDRGADPHYVTDKGWDAVQFAELGKHDDVAALIAEAQAQ